MRIELIVSVSATQLQLLGGISILWLSDLSLTRATVCTPLHPSISPQPYIILGVSSLR
jgi:hypothetical protein